MAFEINIKLKHKLMKSENFHMNSLRQKSFVSVYITFDIIYFMMKKLLS